MISRLGRRDCPSRISTQSGETPTSSTILGPFLVSPLSLPRAGRLHRPQPTLRWPDRRSCTALSGILTPRRAFPTPSSTSGKRARTGNTISRTLTTRSQTICVAKFTTNEKGEYWYYCYKPTAYSLPTDGMSGRSTPRLLATGICRLTR